MSIKYCLPIIKQSKQDILYTIRSSATDYTYFEVWLDYVSEFDDQFLHELVTLGDKIVIVFRRQNLDPIQMPLDTRKNILKQLHNTALLVDLDVTVQSNEIEYVIEGELRLHSIFSYHNYEHTLPFDELEKMVMYIQSRGPEIIKLSTYCQSPYDAIRLLQIQQQLSQQHLKHIVLGMGPFGYATRVFGTLWGNEMIFAPNQQASESAPSQLTRDQLEKIFSALGEK